jgi:hypothetical protein
MRGVDAQAMIGVMTALLMVACASGGSNAWVDLQTDASAVSHFGSLRGTRR